MTGAFLRVKRGDKFEAIEVEHLTRAERTDLLGSRSTEEVLRWMDLVCEELVKAEAELDAGVSP